jgi:hypothetical protein
LESLGWGKELSARRKGDKNEGEIGAAAAAGVQFCLEAIYTNRQLSVSLH